MQHITAWAVLLASTAGVIAGAEALVRGASALARRLGISAFVIGLTVVAYGTSMPELAVSGVAALRGNADIALGNVVGSSIANIGLILGVALIVMHRSCKMLAGRGDLLLLVASALLLPAVVADGGVGRVEGVLLVALALLVTRWFYLHPAEAPTEDVARTRLSLPRALLLVAGGLALLLLGGHLLVGAAIDVASLLGVPDRIIGLTIVAVGTSAPELVTSLVAARRKEGGIAIGNVIGSNVFNVALVLGGSAAISPLHADLSAALLDMVTVVALSVLTALLFWRRCPRHWEGGLLLAGYVVYLVVLVQ